LQRELRRRFARAVATLFYIGFSPFFPGTLASLVALALVFIIPSRVSLYSLTALGILLVSLWATQVYATEKDEEDPQEIVVDELVGILVTFFSLPKSAFVILTGFVLFRFFDIFKPFPVRQIERCPKPWGIVADDVMAGVYANLTLRLLLSLTS
jgi:phosphatidylglycerophosphatase A